MGALQLCDYLDGYQFRMRCTACGYGWHESPEQALLYPGMHQTMYLSEVAASVPCKACRKRRVSVSPILMARHHHFIGGMV